jgi:hypothetical protein
MAEIVSFKRAKKAADRVKSEQKAAENRVRFGRTKAEKSAEKAKADQAGRQLDGARLVPITPDASDA